MIVGIGVDIVEIERIERAVHRRGDRFLDKILTEPEKTYCTRPRLKAQSVAARFAAKEALFKSLPAELQPAVRWSDVQVINDETGKPALWLLGEAARALSGFSIHLTISHERRSAVAVVILEQQGDAV